ncbi:MAG: DUF1826 domain-containing protein [Bacteroidota bacterium]
MNLVSFLPSVSRRKALPRQVLSSSWNDRNQILSPEVNFYCWKRVPDQQVSSYLASLVTDGVPLVKSSYTQYSLPSLIQEVKSSLSNFDCAGSDFFWTDVQKIASDFLTMTEMSTAILHFKTTDSNECSKFHTDRYRLRLFSTLVGKGTQWLPERATNRNGLGKMNGNIVKDPSMIEHMEAYDVGILKGDPHGQKGRSTGIVHRSPQVRTLAERRLILRIDA